MDENGTYSWPGGQNTRPKKKPDFKRAGRTVIAVIAALLVLAVALTCFYTVDDKQQAVVTRRASTSSCHWVSRRWRRWT